MRRRVIALLMTLALLASLMPAVASAAEYPGQQGKDLKISLRDNSTIKLADIAWDSSIEPSVSGYYLNIIKTQLDAESDLVVDFTPTGSGSQKATTEEVAANAMPHIKVYRKADAVTQKSPVASMSQGNIILHPIGPNSANTNVQITIKSGALQPGTDYALVFDEGLAIKEGKDTIGVDIIFEFQTKAAQRGLALNKTSLESAIGQEEELTATFDKVPVASDQIAWTSSNSDVATVERGKVTMISEGVADITASYQGQKVVCQVIVGTIAYSAQGDKHNQFSMLQPSSVKVLSINDQCYLNRINTKFHDDQDISFFFTMSSGLANFGEQDFKNSQMQYFTVCETYGGTVEASSNPSNGQALLQYVGYDSTKGIQIKIAQGALEKGTHYLVVNKGLHGNNPEHTLGRDIVFEFKLTDPNETVPVEKVSLNWKTVTLAQGAELTLQPSFEPEDADNKALTWESSDPQVAAVDAKGIVTAKAAGTATITATSQETNKAQAQCRVEVIDSDISLSDKVLDLSKNQEETLKATRDGVKLQPKWSSSASGIVSVDENGAVKGLAPGTALIWAEEGSSKTVCSKTVCAVTVISAGNYGYQGRNGNSMMLRSPDNVYLKEQTDDYYMNGINPPLDGTEHIIFGFSMSAGMNNFNKDNIFTKNNLPRIRIFKKYPGSATDIVAQSNNTSGQAKLEMLEYDGSGKIYIKLPKFSLRDGTYYLVFDKAICGNNTGKTLGKDVVFKFRVQWPAETMQVELPGDGRTLEEAVRAGLEFDETIAGIENLQVITSGYTLTAADFQFLREQMKSTLKTLDVSKAAIVGNKLPANALSGCAALRHVALPAVTSLEEGSLRNCGALTEIKFTGAKPPAAGTGALDGTKLSRIIVPSGAVASYQAASPWKNYLFYIEASGVSLNKKTLTVPEGKTAKLTANVLPANASDKTVTWSSQNEDIATVKDGVVTGVRRGETMVTVKTKDGEYEASCKVTVCMPPPVITLNQTRGQLYTTGTGRTFQMTAAVSRSEIFNDQDVEWTSSDTSVAEVDENGLVTGKAAGVAAISAWVDDQSEICVMIVKEHTISLDKTAASVFAGGSGSTQTLRAQVDGTAVSGSQVTWSSSDAAVASVSRTGIITGKKAGAATITAVANDKTATCAVNVKVPTLQLNKTKATVYTKARTTVLLTAAANGAKLPGTQVSWESSRPKIATVSSSGVVTGRKKGKATITAAVNGKTAACVVTVKAPTLTVAKKSLTVKKGKTVKIKAKATPKGKVKYTSKDKKIATVNKSGKVKGKKKGKTTIRIKCNGMTRNVKIRVK